MSNNKPLICLLGASFDTGNLGFNALTESTIKCLLRRWPNARFVLLGTDRDPGTHTLSIENHLFTVEKSPIRFCKNIRLPYHYLYYVLAGILLRLIPTQRIKNYLKRKNRFIGFMIEAEYFIDITGGDSFSDIYGLFRMILGFLCKSLVFLYRKPLFLFPQTYGPYHKNISKIMARFILHRSKVIYARDLNGVEFLNAFLKRPEQKEKIRYIPDVAFILDPLPPSEIRLIGGQQIPQHQEIVGLNISGLLYHGGYTQDNMFNLSVDYPEMIFRIIDEIINLTDDNVLLVPHVFPHQELMVESDPVACEKIYEQIHEKYSGRLFSVSGSYNHNEIKYVIGQCKMMMGSRMHSCIASLSQGIPTLGLAYSKKFEGVFKSVGMGKCVVDLRTSEISDAIAQIQWFLGESDNLKKELQDSLPSVKNEIVDFCKTIKWQEKLKM